MIMFEQTFQRGCDRLEKAVSGYVKIGERTGPVLDDWLMFPRRGVCLRREHCRTMEAFAMPRGWLAERPEDSPGFAPTASSSRTTDTGSQRGLCTTGYDFVIVGIARWEHSDWPSTPVLCAHFTGNPNDEIINVFRKDEVTRPDVETVGEAKGGIERSATSAIFELRRISGLTFERLAEALGVSLRTVYAIANGRTVDAANEERLHRLLTTMKVIDRGTGRRNRDLLLSDLPDGRSLIELLAEGRFDEAVALVGRGPGRKSSTWLEPSAEALARRTSRHPVELLGAIEDAAPAKEGRHLPTLTRRLKVTR